MVEAQEKFGFFRITESWEDAEVKRAMDAVWGITPRHSDYEFLTEVELVPRPKLESQTAASQTDKGQGTFVDRAIEFMKGKDTAEA